MTVTNDGGPVFHGPMSPGMTLRDYFAAAYLQGYIANPGPEFPSREAAAQQAYKMADAMLKARDQ